MGLPNSMIGRGDTGTEPGEFLKGNPESLHDEPVEPGVANTLVSVNEEQFTQRFFRGVIENTNDQAVVERCPAQVAVDDSPVPGPIQIVVVIAEEAHAPALLEENLFLRQGAFVVVDHPDQEALPEFLDITEEEKAERQRVVIAEGGVIDLATVAKVVRAIPNATVVIRKHDQSQVGKPRFLDWRLFEGRFESDGNPFPVCFPAAPHDNPSLSPLRHFATFCVWRFSIYCPYPNGIPTRIESKEMKTRIPIAVSLLLASFWFGQVPPLFAGPDAKSEKPTKPDPRGQSIDKGPKEPGERGDPLRNLSPEERERFREAMRHAWNDPAVLQARDEVKKATVAYQKALIEVIKRNDPKVMAMMEKVRSAPDSPIKSLFSGAGPGGRGRPGGGFRDFEAFVTGESPGFLKNLTEEQREIYRKAREKALNSSKFQEVVGKLRELRKSDEAMRESRIELFGRARRTLHTEMIEADERVKAFLPKEEFRSKGPPRGPGPVRKRPDGEPGNPPEKSPKD